MLQKTKWLEGKNVIIVTTNTQNSLASLKSFHEAYLTCEKTLKDDSLIATVLNSNYDLSSLHKYQTDLVTNDNEPIFSQCNINGCSLPSKNLF